MPRLLITNNHLRQFGGSELVTLELVEEFVARGWHVDVYSNLVLPPFSREFDDLVNSGAVRLSLDPYEDFGLDYDLIWVHHNLLPDSVIRRMSERTFHVPLVWHHMSGIAHVEFPHLADIESSIADRSSFISSRTREKLLPFGLDESRTSLFANPVPRTFLDHPSKELGPLRRIVVVSNHVPAELLTAISALEDQGLQVVIVGGAAPQRVTPTLLSGFDAVITIGKTAQYALTLGLPVYIYDHFGGEGWLGQDNFEREAETNFSGRSTYRQLEPESITQEILTGFELAQAFSKGHRKIHGERYGLPGQIDALLAEPWFISPTPKRLNEAQSQRWVAFAEQFRGLYRTLEYMTDERNRLAEEVLALTGTSLEIDPRSAPLEYSGVAVVLEVQEQPSARLLQSLTFQSLQPEAIFLHGEATSRETAFAALSPWAELQGVQLVDCGETYVEVEALLPTSGFEYLAFLTQNSIWLHTFLESSVDSLLRNPSAPAAVSKSLTVWEESPGGRAEHWRENDWPTPNPSHLSLEMLLLHDHTPLSGLVLRRSTAEAHGLPSIAGSLARSWEYGLRISRKSPIACTPSLGHCQVLTYLLSDGDYSIDLDLLAARRAEATESLLELLLRDKSGEPALALMLMQTRILDEALQAKHHASINSGELQTSLDALTLRLPGSGFEHRIRQWAVSLPNRTKGAISRRLNQSTRRSGRAMVQSNAKSISRLTLTARDHSAKLHASGLVSFDVFDTLLDRPLLRPIDVFALVAEFVRENNQVWLSPQWAPERIAAEQACYTTLNVGPDISLEDIYDELKARRIAPDHVLEFARQAELQIEQLLLAPTRRGRELYAEAQSLGLPIVITSDMYLPPASIAQALHSAGFTGWSSMIVSGYDKVGKHSGTAFTRLKSTNPGVEIVHFGDNFVSDVSQPRRFGIEAVHTPRPLDVEDPAVNQALHRFRANNTGLAGTDFASSLIGGLIQRRKERDPEATPLAAIGYSVLGPALVGLSQWIDHQARADGVEHLAFLAREGKLMMEAYTAYWGEEALPSEYVYASRRMINLTQVSGHFDATALEFLTATGSPLAASEYVRRFVPDFPLDLIDEVCRRNGVRADTILGIDSVSTVREIFTGIEREFIEAIAHERGAVLDYLASQKIDEPTTAVVDIGWQGSIQKTIETVLNPRIRGYYFAIHDTPRTKDRTSLNGFIDARTSGNRARWHERHLLPGIEVVELLFTNPSEPSVASVRREGDDFLPVYSSEKLGQAEGIKLTEIQNAALDFVRDFRALSESLPGISLRLPPEIALEPLAHLITAPTSAQALALGAFPHDNSLGVVSSPLGMPQESTRHYRSNPDALAGERENAWWKPGFDENARARGI